MQPLGPVAVVAAGAAACVAAVFLRAARSALRAGPQAWLAAQPADEPATGWPPLAVIFAARDEAAVVEPATRSLLGQDYPGLRVIAADDRSTDGTGAILDRLAAEDARLRVVHIQELPPGWLGKTHALQAAADAAEAEWLLFTDADVVFEPRALRRAMGYALAHGVDHLVVAPDTLTDNEAERVFLAMFCTLFGLLCPPWNVPNPRSRTAVGVGAFNLVRAEAFQAIGGFRRLALSVDDDLKLGMALKYAGYRPAILLGRGEVAVRWQVGLGGLIRGLEKNFFALCDYRLAWVAVMVLVIVGVGILPYVGLFVGPWWSRGVALFAIAVLALSLGGLKGLNGLAWYHALVLPSGAVACLVALLRSTVLTLVRRGVRWRDRFYPLTELRAHARRRNDWLREVWRSTR